MNNSTKMEFPLRLTAWTGKIVSIGIVSGGTCMTSCKMANKPQQRPNILLIVADDMGFSDLGCLGGEISTSNLDKLANNGIRYTQFYNAGRSWPTRSSLMTGYYYQAVSQSNANNRPEGWSRSIPHFLKTSGYHSYLSGKWHVHELPKPCTDAGFDHSYQDANMSNLYVPYDFVDDKPLQEHQEGYQATTTTGQAIRMLREHHTAHPDDPFFMYLTYTIPHFPLQAPQEDIDKYKSRYLAGWDSLRKERAAKLKQSGIVDCDLHPLESKARWHYQEDQLLLDTFGPGEILEAVPWETLTDEQKEFQAMKMSIHAAMVDRMDQEIGKVLDQLRTSGDFENTIIFFLSDNGCSAEILVRGEGHDPDARMGSAATHLCLGPGFASASNTPLRRSKIWVHEGGISTPLIVHWGERIKTKNELRHTSAHIVDLMPTILELAGVRPYEVAGNNYPYLHGISLVPSFDKDKTVERDFLYFNHEGNYALRAGDWKIVGSEIDGKVWNLYNLTKDRGEVNDLSKTYPEKLQEMAIQWDSLTRQYRAQNSNPTPPQLIDDFVKHDIPSKNTKNK